MTTHVLALRVALQPRKDGIPGVARAFGAQVLYSPVPAMQTRRDGWYRVWGRGGGTYVMHSHSVPTSMPGRRT